MGDLIETVKTAFDKKTGMVIVGGVFGALAVLMISNALQDAPNLLFPSAPAQTAPASTATSTTPAEQQTTEGGTTA